MANEIGWGKAVNNDIGWGACPVNDIGAGSVYAVSEFGETLGIKDSSAPEFIISVKTDNVGTSTNEQFTLPMIVGTYDVDWGDTNVDLAQTGAKTHTYSVAGTYDITVTGGTQYTASTGGDALKLIDIKNWGTSVWTSFAGSFSACKSLTTLTATDVPDLSSVTDMSLIFRAANSLIVDVSLWNVSNITNMNQAFFSNYLFDSDTSLWDVTSVLSVNQTFRNCYVLNSGIGSWNTSNITDMTQVLFNCDLFDQDISGWTVTQVTAFASFMSGSIGLSTANYDALLIAWDAQAMSYSGTVDFGGSTYTSGGAADAARTSLISKWGAIVDGGAA